MASLTSFRVTDRVPLSSARLTDAPRQRPVVCAAVLFAADCCAIALTLLCTAFATRDITHLVTGRELPGPPDLTVLSLAVIGYLVIRGRYNERITFWNELRLTVYASLFAVAIEAALGLTGGDFISRAPTFGGLLTLAVTATALNALAKQLLLRTGIWALPILTIGNGATAAAAEAALTADRLLGYDFVGRVGAEAVLSAPPAPCLWPLLRRYGARRLLIALDDEGDQRRRIIEYALRERVPFAMVPQPEALPAFAFEASRGFGQDTMLLSYRNGLARPVSRAIKAAIDVSVASVVLVLSSWLFLILAVLSRLDGGPMLFAHQRVGAGGRKFKCLKFRTMVVDADRVLLQALQADPTLAAEWAATRKLVNDPRVTRLGQFLRKSSLDELPQLINVLRLEMSLVGPRPIVESEVPLYGESIAQYYATRPGLTGLWQVSGRSNTSYAKRVQLDVWYVNNWTIWNDIAVLFKTIPAVLFRQGAV